MNQIIIYYKLPEWTDWVVWICKDEEEAKNVRIGLKDLGYILKE